MRKSPLGAIPKAPSEPPYRDFGMLKVRKMKIRQAEAVVFNQGDQQTDFSRMSNDKLIKICRDKDMAKKRQLSRWFFQTNGMYNRAVRYLADILKFDFMLYPNLDLDKEIQDAESDKILKKFNEVLEHFDNSAIQLLCRKWAAQICIDGAYYGYICDDVNDKLVIQDLPTDYCRSRFLHRGLPLVEFNVEYFNKVTNNDDVREQYLALFPDEIQEGYRKFKNGKMKAETQGDKDGWMLLDVNRAFKLNFYGDWDQDIPPFLQAIPSLIELSEVQDLEKEKLLQQIQKILIQKFELDKNGQIPFTMPELQRLNQNAIDMVGDAVGVSVLSTIADVHLEDLNNGQGEESNNSVDAAEENTYNNFGIASNLFNTDGNLALEKSIITDEAYVKPLLLQFEQFFNRYLEWKFNKNSLKFRLKMLNTSIFNYKEISTAYKDLTKIGFSRFLPIVALGHTQKEVTSMAKLEQQIMQLDAYMLPPFSSNTMSSDTWSDIKAQQEMIIQGRKAGISNPATAANEAGSGAGNAARPSQVDDGGKGGRPAMPADQRSDKTLANQASQG